LPKRKTEEHNAGEGKKCLGSGVPGGKAIFLVLNLNIRSPANRENALLEKSITQPDTKSGDEKKRNTRERKIDDKLGSYFFKHNNSFVVIFWGRRRDEQSMF